MLLLPTASAPALLAELRRKVVVSLRHKVARGSRR